jgi:hypothetical protein
VDVEPKVLVLVNKVVLGADQGLKRDRPAVVSQQHHPWLNFGHFSGDFCVPHLAGPFKMRLVFAKKKESTVI